MQTDKPTSVLVFLGACLAFAEALAGTAGALDKDMSGVWVLAFGTFNLILVLMALLYMFWSRPEFLIAERRDAVPLRVIEAIVRQNDPLLVKELLAKLDLKTLAAHTQELPSVDEAESAVTEEERRRLEEEQAKIKNQLPQEPD